MPTPSSLPIRGSSPSSPEPIPPGELGTDYAGRVFVEYATTWWNGHLGYSQVGERFNLEVGFPPRRGYRKPQARFFLDVWAALSRASLGEPAPIERSFPRR